MDPSSRHQMKIGSRSFPTILRLEGSNGSSPHPRRGKRLRQLGHQRRRNSRSIAPREQRTSRCISLVWDGGTAGTGYALSSSRHWTLNCLLSRQPNRAQGKLFRKLCRSPLSIRSSLQSQIANRKCHCLSSLTQIQDTFGVAGRPWRVFGTPFFGCLTAIKPNVYRPSDGFTLQIANQNQKSKIPGSCVFLDTAIISK